MYLDFYIELWWVWVPCDICECMRVSVVYSVCSVSVNISRAYLLHCFVPYDQFSECATHTLCASRSHVCMGLQCLPSRIHTQCAHVHAAVTSAWNISVFTIYVNERQWGDVCCGVSFYSTAWKNESWATDKFRVRLCSVAYRVARTYNKFRFKLQ